MPNYETPASFKPGLRPRETRFGGLKDVPALRDAIDILTPDEIRDLIPRQDGLRPYIPPCYGNDSDGIYDQKQVGSCAAEAKDQGVSVIRMTKGLRWVKFNPYGTYHTTSGGVDQGSTLDGNLKFAMEFGCFPEDVWPRSNGWQVRPSEEAWEAAYNYRVLEAFDLGSIPEMQTALVKGWPVYYGSDSHAKLYVQALDMPLGEYANSWHSSWGDRGFGTERFDNVWITYGAFAFRSVTDTDPVPKPKGGA